MLGMLVAAAGATALAGSIDVQPGWDRQNPHPFVAGRVAGAIRLEGGEYHCVTSINGQPGERGDHWMCTVLTEASGAKVLRQAGADAEYWGVESIQIEGTAAAELGDVGSLVFSSSAQIVVRPDGSIAACTPIGRPVMRPVPGFEYAPDVCTLYPPGTERIFATEPARTASSEALFSVGFYLRRP